jgi:hypothetical protein
MRKNYKVWNLSRSKFLKLELFYIKEAYSYNLKAGTRDIAREINEFLANLAIKLDWMREAAFIKPILPSYKD